MPWKSQTQNKNKMLNTGDPITKIVTYFMVRKKTASQDPVSLSGVNTVDG